MNVMGEKKNKALFHFTKLSLPKLGFKKDRRELFARYILSSHRLVNPVMTILCHSHFIEESFLQRLHRYVFLCMAFVRPYFIYSIFFVLHNDPMKEHSSNFTREENEA